MIITAAELFDLEPEAKTLDSDRAYAPKHWDVDPIAYQNRQWAVTDYGIENITGPYHYYIEKDRLSEDWPYHMEGKNWVDDAAFSDAYGRALDHFKKAKP